MYVYHICLWRKNLESESCKNFPSRLTRSISSLKMGATSQAWLQWLSGNDMGNKANGAWTIPTPGTVPDLCKLKKKKHNIRHLYLLIPYSQLHIFLAHFILSTIEWSMHSYKESYKKNAICVLSNQYSLQANPRNMFALLSFPNFQCANIDNIYLYAHKVGERWKHCSLYLQFFSQIKQNSISIPNQSKANAYHISS